MIIDDAKKKLAAYAIAGYVAFGGLNAAYANTKDAGEEVSDHLTQKNEPAIQYQMSQEDAQAMSNSKGSHIKGLELTQDGKFVAHVNNAAENSKTPEGIIKDGLGQSKQVFGDDHVEKRLNEMVERAEELAKYTKRLGNDSERILWNRKLIPDSKNIKRYLSNVYSRVFNEKNKNDSEKPHMAKDYAEYWKPQASTFVADFKLLTDDLDLAALSANPKYTNTIMKLTNAVNDMTNAPVIGRDVMDMFNSKYETKGNLAHLGQAFSGLTMLRGDGFESSPTWQMFQSNLAKTGSMDEGMQNMYKQMGVIQSNLAKSGVDIDFNISAQGTGPNGADLYHVDIQQKGQKDGKTLFSLDGVSNGQDVIKNVYQTAVNMPGDFEKNQVAKSLAARLISNNEVIEKVGDINDRYNRTQKLNQMSTQKAPTASLTPVQQAKSLEQDKSR